MKYSNQGFQVLSILQVAYAYNWRGAVEFGPYFNLKLDIKPYLLHHLSGGLMVEYNFIKNRGRKKYVPSIGLSFGAAQDSQKAGPGWHLTGGIHGSLKMFVGARTPFTVTLGYRVLTPSSQFGRALQHQPYLSTGFSYYFDFY